MTERLQKLRKGLFQGSEICPERLDLITRAWEENTEGPIIKRRAKALDKILRNITVTITDGELIVGNLAGERLAVPVFPEFSQKWLRKLIPVASQTRYQGAQFFVDERNVEGILRNLEQWEGKSNEDHIRSRWRKEVRDAVASETIEPLDVIDGYCGIVSGYDQIIQKGFKGKLREIKEVLKRAEKAGDNHKMDVLESFSIACKAAIRFAERYAEKAEELALVERNSSRKAELQEIVRICRKVPANPADTFWEALQSLWFAHLIVQIEANGLGVSFGRFDQFMYPCYKKDLEEGRITREDAAELLGCFFIKCTEIRKLQDYFLSLGWPSMFQTITLGGQDIHGDDVTNDLSYLVLEVAGDLKLVQPPLQVRNFPGAKEEFLLRALGVVATGVGYPAFQNDNRVISWYHRRGVPFEEAVNYAIQGCEDPALPGRDCQLNHGVFNVLKVLELTLNNGVDPRTGIKAGLATGDWESYKSFEQLMTAYKQQVNYIVQLSREARWVVHRVHQEMTPLPYLSTLVDDCIEKGMEQSDGGCRYDYRGNPKYSREMVVGLVNVADSLAAIKKAVFEEQKISMKELKEACLSNFERKEDLRQKLINKVPHFGNDDDYVDSIAREVQDSIYDSGGDDPLRLYHTVGFHVYNGETTGATPDGRKAGEPLADAGASPVQGLDKNGPTALIRSASKIDPAKRSWAYLLNMKFNVDSFRGEENLRNILTLIKTYHMLGGNTVQFNVVNPETLIDAQKHPEKYQNLIVRVAGFSAYFVELDRRTQDEIIRRTTHAV